MESGRDYYWAVDAVGENGIRKDEISSVIILDYLGMKPVLGIKL